MPCSALGVKDNPFGRLATAPLDLQLRQRSSQRGVYRGHFLIGDLFFESRRGPLTGLLDSCFIDRVRSNSHSSDNGNAFSCYFHETLTHRQKLILPISAHDHFAWDQLRDESDMLWQDSHLSFYAGKRDHFDVRGKLGPLRR